ncbi:MAG: universal stress protein [Corynebacterium sp.]|uniref:universal stress protein n=1 Tax=unclassified Corynebacterium TaxID=2624378 RepID=UPI0026491D05|nr:universal stress protein [Corynebacterium sp.]MDN5582467.1 universal stress protein [Corynebacterium sp.]MDN5719895.1 universal stress protein [Corynebacterium sp.]MDN6326343.1 universal stress protein [Corynebacterium sp.]MDN6386112.1 universal stress protein [Corynebacterium sp.]MDN6509788.1 universal stress protein [Corynebacterium sp.]
MTKTIVTGVDSSQTALAAADKAAELAAGTGAELHVLSAFSISGTVTLEAARANNPSAGTQAAYRRLTESYSHAAQEVADSVSDVLREKYPSITVHAAAVEGTPAEALLKKADELDADTIVVGNKHVQGFSRILGSIARKVAAESPCDLYIVNTTQQ